MINVTVFYSDDNNNMIGILDTVFPVDLVLLRFFPPVCLNLAIQITNATIS